MNTNSNYVKILAGFGITIGTFGLGFLMWKLYKQWKQQKQDEAINNFKKNNQDLLKDGVPHMHEAGDKLDEIKEINVNGEKTSIKAAGSSSTPQTTSGQSVIIEFDKIRSIFKEITHLTVDTLMRAYKYLEDNPQVFKGENEKKIFKEKMIENLEYTSSSIMVYHKVEPDQFFKSYHHHCQNNQKFKIKAQFLVRLKLSFISADTLSSAIDFPKTVQDNFLKIVSNIFYINAYKTWIEFKSEYLGKGNIPGNSADALYTKYLKETRKIVYEFFKVPKSPEINTKYLVRLYPYTQPKESNLRVTYSKQSELINKILDNLNTKIIPTIFLSETDSSKFVVEDKIIDLEIMLNDTIDYNSLAN